MEWNQRMESDRMDRVVDDDDEMEWSGWSDDDDNGAVEWNGMEWNGMEWNGMEWNGRMEWNGMEWNGMEWNRRVDFIEWNRGMELN